jgi:hypothetical protein
MPVACSCAHVALRAHTRRRYRLLDRRWTRHRRRHCLDTEGQRAEAGSEAQHKPAPPGSRLQLPPHHIAPLVLMPRDASDVVGHKAGQVLIGGSRGRGVWVSCGVSEHAATD